MVCLVGALFMLELLWWECICGLAAAVTDLLQSVQLEYHGYEGEGADTSKGATQEQVKERLNGLFSLVQGLVGTAVVRTYIDQLAQVLSALVGWSKIEKCTGSDGSGCGGTGGDSKPHGQESCEYLNEVTANDPCDKCGCMKWDVPKADDLDKGHHLGRGCQRCKDSGDSAHRCSCTGGGSGSSTCTAESCQCYKKGKCCKCCCKGCDGCKKECRCDGYKSAYPKTTVSWIEGGHTITWKQLKDTTFDNTGDGTPSNKRLQCARIFLGSVCLIWSGITYMYWTGKWAQSSPRWNNHILDGSGLDDGTLSQWLQALGFPREMLNNAGPGNRLDAVIWDGLMGKLFLGFLEPSGLNKNGEVNDTNGNTARSPFGMNYPGFVHTAHRDSFNTDQATVFRNGTGSSTAGQISETNQHKNGAIFKLYILSCAYFTGLQNKAPPKADNKAPRTIREILYWLSALPYSTAYPKILKHGKHRLTEVLKKPDGSDSSTDNDQKQLKFHQTGRTAPITVDEYNLFAHFQAVTQYCPLVLIGIQGGLHSTKGTDSPAIHSLYANTECRFTYPTVPIQAYNQVVHYIRALFYQLYFLRKQCAVKVTCGGKWRECRYGDGVVSKGVISWMCLGCDPMEHDRKCRVGKVKEELDGVMKKVKILEWKKKEGIEKAKALLVAIGDVVVQLGNAQEALEGKKKEAITKVKGKLEEARTGLDTAVQKVKNGLMGDLKELEEAKAKLDALTNGGGALHTLVNSGNGSLHQVTSEPEEWKKNYSSAKDNISEVIHKVREVLEALKKGIPEAIDKVIDGLKQKDVYWTTREILQWAAKQFIQAIEQLLSICNSPKCPPCNDHINKCGKQPQSKICDKCHQQYDDGKPSPLQAFLEDRLPGFSCDNTKELLDKQEAEKAQNKGKDTSHASDLDYPLAASHLEHCGGSGQCCPLPMGFRNSFMSTTTGVPSLPPTGARLYGILYFFSNENMMQSCVYTLVRVTAALSATTPQVLGDVFGFFRGGVGNPVQKVGDSGKNCDHQNDPKTSTDPNSYYCGWCASGLREEVKKIEWIPKGDDSDKGGKYRGSVGEALIAIKGEKSGSTISQPATQDTTSLSTLTKDSEYLSPLTGELYTAVSATFGGTYLSWVLYLSDALHSGLESLASEFQQIECRGCRGCDPNKCKKGSHGGTDSAQCNCSSIVSCTGVLPVLYRHGFSYGNPFNLEGYHQKDGKTDGQYDITNTKSTKKCHQFLESLSAVIKKKEKAEKATTHPLTELLKQVGQLQYDIRFPWIFVLTVAWLVAVLYLAFGAIWPLDWTHMRSHWLRGGAHQWQCMWYKVMTGRKGMELVEYFGRK
ncbi:variant erythrocyte surface antigen-1 alpha subunit [Babesia bovis T2Bo]|uniref:Variant erythrocyte surface antigen-1, alpha subunit n=1 Tax=Babesia bovis TaxID=5865 RepID=A7AX22_BABBO|nr:variant erythrocyte surface antigen-1 alpha subunit [Babesia bovis T2Bo]EDO05600.1 variant erythrocyte surface antigen-1 alpha subunit [Babesia bovis T2Bo]|eukprot:XP_001609168.1 variant erythrocyte surface antigen-1, alpha subunit [Babesia bovis T2Bo]